MAAQTAHQQEAAAERGMADRDVRIYMNLPLYWLVGLALYSVARDKPDLFHDIRALNWSLWALHGFGGIIAIFVARDSYQPRALLRFLLANAVWCVAALGQ